ncbi:MAG TPA: prephenate dehydratase [Solirubrobacteraceae bacterium]|nr:prephenate dehydratase [Solirubrobacteraceae bacterium]
MSAPSEGPGALPRVGYLGPAGTFSEQALLASAREGAVEPVAQAGIYEAVMALVHGEVEYAIVPIENSLEGSIDVTLDLLADASSPEGEAAAVQIVGETLLRVRHSLICAGNTALEEIRSVLTHPQVPGQCTRFLRGELAGAQVLAASSTAEAVRAVVAAGERDRAAIGTELAAEIYGGVVVRAGVQDRDDNETRFVWLAPASGATADAAAAKAPPLRCGGAGEGAAAGDAEWKTSLVFWGAGAERAGWLVRCLDQFARREINLLKIESRPRRGRMGSYRFFADAAARAGEPPLSDALAGLARICEEVRVLGSYPAAAAP